MNFENKVVIVTGAGSGIGEGVAEQFGKAGARVILAEINEDSGRRAESKLRSEQIEATFVRTDVSDESSVRACVRQAAEQYGTIDALINNAGVELWKSVLETSEEEWDRIVGVDLKGVFLMSKACAPAMADSDVRSIVNISSVHAIATVPGLDAYAAAKGGVVSLTRSMALSLNRLRVRVNGISPGYIHTPMWQRVLDAGNEREIMDQVLSFHLSDRIGTPRDIGRVCMFLSSEDAAFINGQVIVVDGGVTIQLKN